MKHFFCKVSFALAFLTSASVIAAPTSDQVSLSDLHIQTTGSRLSSVTGIAHNDTTATLKYVYVKFNLYQGNTIIGETMDIVEFLGPGENWKVNALIDTINGIPDHCKVTEIRVVN